MNKNKTILELSNKEARDFFLQSSKFCTLDLPKYFDFQPLLSELGNVLKGKKVYDIKVLEPKDCENVNYKFLTNKDGNFSWRPFQIINPAITTVQRNFPIRLADHHRSHSEDVWV